MNDYQYTELKIDEVFKNLIPPLSQDEYRQLEENLISDGCREPICVWNGTIIDGHPFELYLALNDIEHRRTKVKSPKTNGFIERFNKTVLDEFFRIAFRENFYESVEALQEDLDRWLVHYNTERPHRGYRNRGKRPLDTVLEFVPVC